jgi:lysophospholipase L1-like esterase
MRRVSFAVAAALLSGAVAVGGLFVLDVWVRARFPIWNRHGYAGPILKAKQPGEYRIAALGGSTVQGYGVTWSDAFPAQLERLLAPGVTVANLGFNNQGAYSYRLTLRYYAYLKPDLVLFYEGYNDLGANTLDARGRSIIFRWTGYFPMLPVVAGEKAMVWRTDDLSAAYAGEKVRFTPNLVRRTGASILETVRALDHVGTEPATATGQQSPLEAYLHNVQLGIAAARNLGAAVLVVGQPRLNQFHEHQQNALREMLTASYPDVEYLNLGGLVDLHDPSLCSDGMHLTPEGNARIAGALAAAIKARRR